MPAERQPLDKLVTVAAWVGAVLLFVSACAFGVLEVHSSNDTWIGLAAGKQILESPEFPKTDTFSFNFNGQPWYNQNWLTHVMQYWVWERFGPNAVIYLTWAIAASVFVLAGLATWWRTGSGYVALLAGAMVGVGCRDFLSARPATTGFFCIAALWALICALEGQGEKRRWWPIVLFLPLLLFWGAAHGSFVFAYGMLGLYVAHWGLMRLTFPRWARISGRQAAGLVIVLLLAFVLTLVLSPFGMHNFTHGGVVAGSPIWRKVSEWNPPYQNITASFPPMMRFWWILGIVGVALFGVWSLGVAGAALAPAGQTPPERERRLHTSLYDIGAVALALLMTLWARRFAPIFYIFSAPIFGVWIMMLLRSLQGRLRRLSWQAVVLGTWLAAITLAIQTAKRAERELVSAFEGRADLDLFDRVTRRDAVQIEALDYLRENDVHLNLFTEWTMGGAVMFYAPSCKVFIDGRAQQVYSEQHYVKYLQLLSNLSNKDRLHLLRESGATGVLFRNAPTMEAFYRGMSQATREWVPVLNNRFYNLYIRRDCPELQKLRERLNRGEEWRPNTAAAMGGRGMLWAVTEPPNTQRARECWTSAIAQDPLLGMLWYPGAVRAFYLLDGREAALNYISEQTQFISQQSQLSPAEQQGLQRALAQTRDWVLARQDKPGADEDPTPP